MTDQKGGEVSHAEKVCSSCGGQVAAESFVCPTCQAIVVTRPAQRKTPAWVIQLLVLLIFILLIFVLYRMWQVFVLHNY